VSPSFTIISVYNRRDILEKYLLPSVCRQDMSAELRLVDNSAGRFRSAAEALNYGASGASGEYLLFVHQDVEFLDSTFLSEAKRHVATLPHCGLAGLVGAVRGRYTRRLRNVVVAGESDIESVDRSSALQHPVEVQTLDELLLIIPRDIFNEMPFDAATCNGWDLYGVDYALGCRRRGLKAYALPLIVRHVSDGRLGPHYYKTLRQVIRKHMPDCGTIYTTCGVWHPSLPISLNWLLHKSRAAFFRLAGQRLGRLIWG
jgi:hypothetical protein